VVENVIEQLCPSESVGERQVSLWGVLIEVPDELRREGPVVVLLHLSVKLLHPPHFDEELGEVPIGLLQNLFLHTVPEFVAAVLPPKGVNGDEVGPGDELHLREEHVAALLGCFSGKHDEETPGFFISLLEVLGGEVVAEEVEGGAGLGGGGGGGRRRRGCGLGEGKGSDVRVRRSVVGES